MPRATVLLAEDEPMIRKLAAHVLRARGYDVIEAVDGQQAWERMSEAVDVIVTDITMPRMTGIELALRVRAECPGVPVLLVSGYSHDGVACPADAGLGVDFLPKPYTMAALGQRVGDLVARAGVRDRPCRLPPAETAHATA